MSEERTVNQELYIQLTNCGEADNQALVIIGRLDKELAQAKAGVAEANRLREEDRAIRTQAYRDFKAKIAELERWCKLWEYGDPHDTPGKKITRLEAALRGIMNELGVPQPGYPANVDNAYEIAQAALAGENPLNCKPGEIRYIPDADRGGKPK
jgi:hypothetical protein